MFWVVVCSVCSVCSVLVPVMAELPACYRESQTCDITDSNMLDWMIADSVETCRDACSNRTWIGSKKCTVFSYHGSESSPYQNVCLLLSVCGSTSPCQDCVTESVSDCTCSLPYQCYVTSDNILQILRYPLPSEQACRTICFDSDNCTAYNYYDGSHSSAGLCVLLKDCQQLVPGPCQGCHAGPDRCSARDGTCQLAVWSTRTNSLAATTSTTVSLMSGEPTCTREVRLMAVGGGGGSLAGRAGGGSGLVVFNTTLVTSNTELEIVVGAGGASNQSGGASVVSYTSGGVLLTAEGGGRAELTNGGDGYSGGGAQGADGGTAGGDGDDYYDFKGGAGSGLNLTDVRFDEFLVSPGEAGIGDVTFGGGGGGGVLVSGPGLEEAERPDREPGEGEGWGGGAGGASEGNEGQQGLVLIETMSIREMIQP